MRGVIVVVVVVYDDTYYWVYLSFDHPFQVYITKPDSLSYYKVRQHFYYKERQVLVQTATEQTVAALEIFVVVQILFSFVFGYGNV